MWESFLLTQKGCGRPTAGPGPASHLSSARSAEICPGSQHPPNRGGQKLSSCFRSTFHLPEPRSTGAGICRNRRVFLYWKPIAANRPRVQNTRFNAARALEIQLTPFKQRAPEIRGSRNFL